MLAPIVEEKKDEIAALCREYRVRALWVFGSATTDRFDPETSDIDFLVDLGVYEEPIVYRYVNFANALETLLDWKIDLVTVRSVKSPIFRKTIEDSRVAIYERGNDKEAA